MTKLESKLVELGYVLDYEKQEINYKTNRNVFTFHKDNQDCFQVVITKNDVYFKENTNHNLSLETMKIIVEFMEYLLNDTTTDKKAVE